MGDKKKKSGFRDIKGTNIVPKLGVPAFGKQSPTTVKKITGGGANMGPREVVAMEERHRQWKASGGKNPPGDWRTNVYGFRKPAPPEKKYDMTKRTPLVGGVTTEEEEGKESAA